MKKKFVFIFIFSCQIALAQEAISVLEFNPVLKFKPIKNIKQAITLPISLPFTDDFSYNSFFPNSSFWTDSAVFVNRTYPIHPITLGVATFDGLDHHGMPYNIASSVQAKRADSLTSQPIDLSVVDSAYLLFYYQSTGLGEMPQAEDSLVLEFLTGTDSLGLPIWQHIWSTNGGQSMQSFQKVVININKAIFLHAAFQFRFRNYATLSGNFDHWHLDYVKLDAYSAGQIPPLNDVAFVYDNPMLLKRYRAMPWVQFKNNPAAHIRDTLDIILRNNQAGVSVDYKYDVFENNNTIEHYPYLGQMNSTRNVQIADYDSIGNYTFSQPPVFLSDTIFESNLSADSAVFLFKNVIKTTPNDRKENDTLTHYQRFYSHYAYDDGVAEYAYGINVQGAKMAYQFELDVPDTLRMIQIYFAPTQNNISNIPFYLKVWDDNNGIPGSVLWTDTVYPKYEDRNQYHSYYLKYPVGVSGVFYVGIEQTTDDMLNVGLDRNSPSNHYMFYNVGGGWNYSQFPGAWMIRPVLRETAIISSFNDKNQQEMEVFPNPFSHFTNILLNGEVESTIQLFDISGRILSTYVTHQNHFQFFKANLNAGIYFLQVRNKHGVFRKKIVIQ